MQTRLAVVGMVVEDMARSLAFYRRLGLSIPAEADTAPHAEAELPGGLTVAWDTVETIRSFEPGFEMPRGGARMSLAFACDTPAGVDAAYAELTADGVPGVLEPWDAVWGMRYAVVQDPDGGTVDLFSPLAAG